MKFTVSAKPVMLQGRLTFGQPMTGFTHPPDSGRFAVGDLTVDLGRREVWRADQRLAIPKLSFQLLAALMRRSPEILSFDQLVEAVWQGRPVTNETLHQRVRLLRKALDDDAADPTYVGLVRGEGYRLLCDVRPAPLQSEFNGQQHGTRNDQRPVPAPESQQRSISRRNIFAWATGAIMITAGIVGWWSLASEEVPGSPEEAQKAAALHKSVAILPFVDMSPERDQQHFGDGITVELLNELSPLDGLRVASPTFSFSTTHGQDVRSIGRALSVATVLRGSVRKSGDQVRVTAQLDDTASGFTLWSQTFERPLTDVFAIQDEIAEAVAGTLGVTLNVGDVNAFSGAGTTNVKAYQAFQRATELYIPRQSVERVRLLERAVELDPNYAAAWASLGLTIAAKMWNSPVEEAPALLARAVPIVRRAVQLNPDSSFAYNMLATVNYATMDWIRSEQYYEKAFEKNPDGETFANYANLMMRAGRSKRSLRYQELAAMAERQAVDSTLNFNAALALGHLDEVSRTRTKFGGISAAVSDLLVALNADDPAKVQKALEAISPDNKGLYHMARAILSNLDSKPQVLAAIRTKYQDSRLQWPAKHHDSALLAAYFGDPEFALQAISHEARLTTIRYGALWYPVMAKVRELPGFEQLLIDVNLVDYYRAYGWTDHCRPQGVEGLECF